jgi:murein DD-endopeptidase MepM/ murein hydrolase activator NlpD
MARKPSPGQVVSGYGPRIDPQYGVSRFHRGVDIAHDKGTDLVAPERARLVAYGVNPLGDDPRGTYGRLAVLEDGTTQHRLAHTERLLDGVSVGDIIAEGDLVAQMGETGRALGVHLHWEVLENGIHIDPLAWLSRAAATPPITTGKADDMLAYIQGKEGVRKGGLYHFRGNVSTLLGTAKPTGVPVITDEAEIKRLAGLYSGDL